MKTLNFYRLEKNTDGLPCMVSEGSSYSYDEERQYLTPSAMYDLAKSINLDKRIEEYFYTLMLDSGGRLIGFTECGHGSVNHSIVSTSGLFQKALLSGAYGLVLFHNHPGGNPNPSGDDLDLTKRIKEGAECLGMRVLDHLIVTESGYYSFASEGSL